MRPLLVVLLHDPRPRGSGRGRTPEGALLGHRGLGRLPGRAARLEHSIVGAVQRDLLEGGESVSAEPPQTEGRWKVAYAPASPPCGTVSAAMSVHSEVSRQSVVTVEVAPSSVTLFL